MPITRHFLGFDTPALAAVVDYLVDQFADHESLDLSRTILVLPGGRAARRLLELLLERADRDNLRLKPPTTATLADLPERLYEPQRPFASDLTQRLAWVKALQQMNPAELKEVLAQLPPSSDPARWLPLGEMLSRLHVELAADGLDFDDVVQSGQSLTGFEEVARWQALRAVQRKYLAILDDLQIWDRQTARLVAIEREECATKNDLLLVGMVDLNRTVRLMLDQVADRVTALVHAPEELADRFDPHGCLLPEAWQDAPLAINEDRIRLAYRAGDQAEAAVRTVAEYGGRFAASEVVIGLPNESLAPLLARKFDECGARTRWVSGRAIEQTGPYQLLWAVGDWLASNRLEDLAAVLRQADLYDWLLAEGIEEGWLEDLDDYRCEHLQARLSNHWLGSERKTARLRAAVARLQQLLAPLAAAASSLEAIAAAVRKLLVEVYGDRELSRLVEADHYLLAACRKIDSTIDDIVKVDPTLRPTLSPPQFLRLMLDELVGEMIASLVDPAAIEMLGWLELPLDDKPALVVTSMNEGFVPKSVNADPFLPNRLRQALKLDDNQRRLARDAYALQVLLATREELTLIVGKVNADGDAVAPSRLLFHETADVVARRALRLFQDQPAEKFRPLATRLPPPQAAPSFYVPLPRPQAAVESLAVTAFRTYLACPYRFYLAHVLRLSACGDEAAEMDGGAFGSLLHDVLAKFGASEAKHLEHAGPIEDFLEAELTRQAKQKFGQFHLPSVEVQLAQLRARLFAFARWQADWAQQGWRIQHTEWKPQPSEAPFEVDGRAIDLRGRVDRIDFNEATGEWMVFDYKSSNNALSPAKAHYSKSLGWIDLQLPLYRYVVQSLEIERPQMGYIVLPRALAEVGALPAEWTAEELDDADASAADVVRQIRAETFWPPKDVNAMFDDFAAICQTTVYDRRYEGGEAIESLAPDAGEG